MRFTTSALALPLLAAAVVAMPTPAGEAERDLASVENRTLDQYEHGTLAIREANGALDSLMVELETRNASCTTWTH